MYLYYDNKNIMIGYGDIKIRDYVCKEVDETDKDYLQFRQNIDISNLRQQRDDECFSIINRGQLWYLTLTEEQLEELNNWYKQWLDVTETKVIPEKPSWLK